MAAVTPSEQAGFFLSLSAMIFGWTLLNAGFYIFTGLALLLSRSLNSFFDYQKECAEGPTRYPILTRDILESLDDIDLVHAVVDYVRLKVGNDYKSEFAIVSSLPRGFQAAYSTWWVQAEVDNGGFYQYFHNQGGDWAFMALEGYQLFGATELADLLARAIDTYFREEPAQLKYRTGDPLRMIEEYVKASDASTLSELDCLFYEADDCEPAVWYIRAHVDEFVAD